MTIIVFLIDTSASMNQRVSLGGRPTLCDAAKSAVETFVKVRQRMMDSRLDRYMLLTFDDPPNNIKAGWKENLQTFMTELKNLQANSLSTLSQALKHTFDVLNVNRMQHGIDTYGQGRCPFYLEPCTIVVITDGGQLCSNSGVTNEIKVSGSSPGVELTREPFRWDQRLFSLVLRMSGQPVNEREIGIVPSDTSPIDSWCEITGGRSYCITSHRMLLQCIDSLAQKVQAGVVLHFEKYGNDPTIIIPAEGLPEQQDDLNNLKWTNCHKMIYVPRQNQVKGFAGGFWPIPEAFWPEANSPALPPRSAHPNVKFVCNPHEPLVIENFPFDKYELEPSPLTQYILARKQPNVCWQVFVPNSSKTNQLGQAFGYLKASTSMTSVNLFVMPYNYTLLLPLLDDLIRIFRMKPTNDWRVQFGMYLTNMPAYYAGPLKRALLRIGAGNIAQMVPEENYLSYPVLNYLKKIKGQAKMEFEKTCNEVGARVGKEPPRRIHVYKNPFDIPRDQLLENLGKLRSYFFRPTTSIHHAEALHNQPVAAMGNYQEFIKRMPQPLREIESAPVRQHMFGNPFKLDKRITIDEAIDIDLVGGGGGGKGNNGDGSSSPSASSTSSSMSMKMKRKAGPISKDFVYIPRKYRKISSPLSDFGSPMPSPLPPASPMYTSDYESDENVPSPSSQNADLMPPVVPSPDEQINFHLPIIASDFNLNEENIEESISKVDEFGNYDDEPIADVKKPVILDQVEKKPNQKVEKKPVTILQSTEVNIQQPPEILQNSKQEHGITSATTIIESPALPMPHHIPAPLANVLGTSLPMLENNETTWKKNVQVRTELHKEIRRPRIRKEYLLSQLSLIAGSFETRLKFMKSLEKEALRFKRKTLAKIFEEQHQEMLKLMSSFSSTNSISNSNSINDKKGLNNRVGNFAQHTK